MAFKRWLGRAGAVAQVDTLTVTGSWATNNTITLTINAKDLVVTIGESSPTTTTVALAIKEAWQNDTFTDPLNSKIPANGGQGFPEHAEITATTAATVTTLTHNTDGTPFTLSVVETASGGITHSAAATAATGPNHWNNADNWDHESGSDLPGVDSADDIFIENSDVSILYGLDQSGISADLGSIVIPRNYTGTIGLPRQNDGGYVEYRDRYLKIPVAVVTIGRGEGSGSGRIKLDTHDDSSAITVVSTGSPAEFGVEAFLFKGATATNSLTVLDGSVAIAAFEDDVAELDTILMSGGTVRIGSGVGSAIATVKNVAGNLSTYSDVTTLTNSGGTLLLGGTAAIATLLHQGGQCRYASSAAIGVLTIGGPVGASFDASLENSPRIITTINIKPNMSINDPLRTLTYSNVVFDSDTRSWSSA